MIGNTARIRKRDKFLKALPFNRRGTSPSDPSTTAQTQPLQPPAPQAASPAQAPQAAAGASPPANQVLIEKVFEQLTEEQRLQLRADEQKSQNINDVFAQALDAAEEKMQTCISKRWTLTLGSRTISTREKADKVIEFLYRFKGVGNIASGADPVHFGLPWAGVSLILQVAVSEKQQMDALLGGLATALSMKQALDVYFAFFEKQLPGPAAENLESSLIELYATVLGFLADATGQLEKGGLSRFWGALLDDGGLQKFGSACSNAEQRVELAAGYCDRVLHGHDRELLRECKGILDRIVGGLDAIKAQTARIELNSNFAKLPRATTAAFDSTDEERLPRCLKQTRTEVLNDIEAWVQNPMSTMFFWLQGVAGTGKSTIARTVAQTLQDHGILGASFFFKRSHGERGNADLFFATIAAQLAQVTSGMGNAIAEVLGREMGTYNKGVSTQFGDLLLKPLQKASHRNQQPCLGLIILIDALDECNDEGDREHDVRHILECLSQLKEITTLRLRVLVTSRPELSVDGGFTHLDSNMHHDILLHKRPHVHIERDIRIFIEAKFNELRRLRSKTRVRDTLGEDWPGDEVISDLANRSAPLFIFASTVCKFVADQRYAPQERLAKVLNNRGAVQLDKEVYRVILEAFVPKIDNDVGSVWDDGYLDRFRKIVGFIIFSSEPPSIAIIAVLLGFPERQVDALLKNLRSVLDVAEDFHWPVRPFHLSFIEFLARPTRRHPFCINERSTHAYLANTCLTLMMEPGQLKQDICRVRTPGARRLQVDSKVVESCISPVLSYACRHWAYHYQQSGESLHDTSQVYLFLSDFFLYWFEAMAWLRSAREVLRIFHRLKAQIRVSPRNLLPQSAVQL